MHFPRRTAGAIAVIVTLLSGSAALGPAAGGTPPSGELPGDLPPGFVDGVPVGGDADQVPPSGGGDGDASPAAAATQRYFGRDPWNALADAAAATSRSCTIADDDLTAMAVAPVFKESSTATSPSTAPAPMTLSRYDEWTGTYGTTTNRDANYTLYAFADPNTSYSRVFWHPGVGIWQYDSSGVGGPFTAIERMDVSIVGADVAAGMAGRYCNPSASVVGHPAPFTDLERRYSAWSPWGYPCTFCEQQFQELVGTEPHFANVTLVDGIDTTGGAVKRTCTLAGVSGSVDCWYVNPSVGVIQGATGWATLDPTGGSPTVAPTPLARPFYVVDRGATEERHWLREDTGYAIDISGSRQIGKNDRVRANQPGTGVTWANTSGLCDLTTGRGTCGQLLPPPGVTRSSLAIDGTFRVVPLDAQGDGKGDMLLYGAGTAPDELRLGQGSGAFSKVAVSVKGTYDDVLPFDGDGDGDDDVLWYRRSTGQAFIWWSDGDGTFTTETITVAAGLIPLVGRFSGDAGTDAEDIFFYGPGKAADSLWIFTNPRLVASVPISGTYQPFVGNFDGDDFADVYWYAPGPAADYVWYFDRGAHVSIGRSVSGTYQPLVGDYDGDGADDITWYRAGATPDSTWFGTPARTFVNQATPVSSTYTPVVADLQGDGRDDLLWYRPGSGSDVWWRWDANRVRSSTGWSIDVTHQPVAGPFSPGGTDGIVWYAPGTTLDAVWWHSAAS